MGRVCYHPCESACNRAQLDEAVGINSVERFLGDEAIKRGWKFETPAQETGKHVLVVGAGPSGLSAAYHLARLGHAVDDPRSRPAGRRHDALRHSEIPPAARRARRRGASASSIWASSSSSTPRSTTFSTTMKAGRLRRRLPRRRRPYRQARLYPGRRRLEDSRRGLACCARWKARTSRCSAAASWSTAAATPRIDVARTAKRMGADRGDHRLSPHARDACRRMISRSRRRWKKAS